MMSNIRREKNMTLFRIEMMPACSGDCIWIEYGNPQSPHKLLIDGGFADLIPE